MVRRTRRLGDLAQRIEDRQAWRRRFDEDDKADKVRDKLFAE
jgi:hypothetical protein